MRKVRENFNRKEVKRAMEYEKREMGSSKSCPGKAQNIIFERDVVGTRSIISAEVFWSPERWAFYQHKVLWCFLYNGEIDILWSDSTFSTEGTQLEV